MSPTARYASFLSSQPSTESFREEAAEGELFIDAKAQRDDHELAAQLQEVNSLTKEINDANDRAATLEHLICVLENHTGGLTHLQASIVARVADQVNAPMQHASLGYGLEAYGSARGPALINIAVESFKETLQKVKATKVD